MYNAQSLGSYLTPNSSFKLENQRIFKQGQMYIVLGRIKSY